MQTIQYMWRTDQYKVEKCRGTISAFTKKEAKKWGYNSFQTNALITSWTRRQSGLTISHKLKQLFKLYSLLMFSFTTSSQRANRRRCYRVFRKKCVFSQSTVTHFAARELQSSRRNVSVQSLLMAVSYWHPIAAVEAQCWRGRVGKKQHFFMNTL